jgi:hypothetical protein
VLTGLRNGATNEGLEAQALGLSQADAQVLTYITPDSTESDEQLPFNSSEDNGTGTASEDYGIGLTDYGTGTAAEEEDTNPAMEVEEEEEEDT